MILLPLLVLITQEDYWTLEISDHHLLCILFLAYLKRGWIALGEALLLLILLTLCYVLLRHHIGYGDIKYFSVLGAYGGPHALGIILLKTLFLTAGFCLVLLLLRKIERKDEIALGPFISLAALLSLM